MSAKQVTLLGLLLVFMAGCANFKTVQGVSSPWEDGGHPAWEKGKTTQSDVLDALGPPSQIIDLQDRTVFYYLRERASGSAQIFILYNTGKMNVEYDRAIFFFDKEGILRDVSYSEE